MSKPSVRRSKQLSWLLRHGANEAGLSMDEAGWADVEEVLVVLDMTRANLLDAVETNDKGRLQLDGTRIRACQGRSLDGMPVTQDALERSWTVISPASSLWHGTTIAAVDGIAADGIRPSGRSHVHLAPSTASRVGKRASVDVLLEISPTRLVDLGVSVFEARNGVVLVRHVPAAAIIDVWPGSNGNAIDTTNLRRSLRIDLDESRGNG